MNSEPKIIEFPKIQDPRGNLTYLQNDDQIPFEIQRVFWIYDIPGGQIRGGHAFYKQEEVIVALSGSFDVVLFDGKKESKIHLNRSYKGLYIPNKIWRQMENFSTNSVALVISSTKYDTKDYIRDLDEFKKII